MLCVCHGERNLDQLRETRMLRAVASVTSDINLEYIRRLFYVSEHTLRLKHERYGIMTPRIVLMKSTCRNWHMSAPDEVNNRRIYEYAKWYVYKVRN